MLKSLSIVVTVAILCLAGATLVQAAPADGPAQASEVKVQPKLKARPKPDYPDGEKAQGHGGYVFFKVMVGADGRVIEAAVTMTSAGPVLTQSAMVAARSAEFTPAKDASGGPVAASANLAYQFSTDDVNADTISYVEPIYDDAARDAGMHGELKVRGVIGGDGRLKDVSVLESSRSAELDRAAVTAAQATVFRVYLDGDGQLVERAVELPYEFSSYRSEGAGGGALRYHCAQFVRDQTWWNATWPATEHDELYTIMLGVSTSIAFNTFGGDYKKVETYLKTFGPRWAKAVEACRSKPKALFIDVFRPEGDLARSLAGGNF